MVETEIVEVVPDATEVVAETEGPVTIATETVIIEESTVEIASFGSVESAGANTARVIGTGGAGVRCRASQATTARS